MAVDLKIIQLLEILYRMVSRCQKCNCRRYFEEETCFYLFYQFTAHWKLAISSINCKQIRKTLKKMLESRSEDALVKLVESVEIVESVETVETVETLEIVEYIPDICHFFLYRQIF